MKEKKREKGGELWCVFFVCKNSKKKKRIKMKMVGITWEQMSNTGKNMFERPQPYQEEEEGHIQKLYTFQRHHYALHVAWLLDVHLITKYNFSCWYVFKFKKEEKLENFPHRLKREPKHLRDLHCLVRMYNFQNQRVKLS